MNQVEISPGQPIAQFVSTSHQLRIRRTWDIKKLTQVGTTGYWFTLLVIEWKCTVDANIFYVDEIRFRYIAQCIQYCWVSRVISKVQFLYPPSRIWHYNIKCHFIVRIRCLMYFIRKCLHSIYPQLVTRFRRCMLYRKALSPCICNVNW